MKIKEDFYLKTEKNCSCKEKEISRKTDQRIVFVYKVYDITGSNRCEFHSTSFSFFFNSNREN